MNSSKRLLIAISILALPMFAGQAGGIKNFDQVDDHVYRGGQPSNQAFPYLAGLGVKVVIDLREPGGRAQQEERAATAAGMKYVNVPMTGLTPPTQAEIRKILTILEDAGSGKVFVHCMRGADRTGAVIAAYHIEHDKWQNERALKDAMAHGMSFFQLPRQSFIRRFQPLTMEAEAKPVDAQNGAAVPPVAAPAGSVKNQ